MSAVRISAVRLQQRGMEGVLNLGIKPCFGKIRAKLDVDDAFAHVVGSCVTGQKFASTLESIWTQVIRVRPLNDPVPLSSC